MNKPTQPSFSDERHRRSRLVLQTLVVLLVPFFLILTSPLLVSLVTPFPDFSENDNGSLPTPLIVIAILASALIILVRLGQPTISALALIGAWTLVTTLTSVRFGVTSNFPALLIVPICIAGLVIDRVACLSLAALATLVVGSAAWHQQSIQLIITSPEISIANGEFPDIPLLAASFWISLFWTVALLTSLLAGGLQRALQQSRAQAEELRLLSEQLEARVVDQTAQILAGEREGATIAERARLAREIHDTLAQGLTGIVVQLGAAQRALAVAPAAADEHLDLAARMARESLAEARRSVWNLRSADLERGDLGDALSGLAERQARSNTPATFRQSGEPWPLPLDIESALLRVAQEALANVAKHAQASQVQLTLEYQPDVVRLLVSDDGAGFDEASLSQTVRAGPWGGFGLAGMRERLAALGGSLELRNDHGATVEARVLRPASASFSGASGATADYSGTTAE
jgi:signal transduction histidine kinase